MKLSNPNQAQMAWDEWFVPFFKTIDDNSDVVKAVHYINCHWDSHRMWFDNPTFKGIDARLHLSDTISKRWVERKLLIQTSIFNHHQVYMMICMITNN